MNCDILVLSKVGMLRGPQMIEAKETEAPALFVIDKDSFTRHKLLKLLSGVGFSVTTFQDVGALLDCVRPSFPAAVLVVDKCGNFNIAEFSSKVKSLNELVPLVLLLPNAEVKHAVEAMRQGVSELIEMPFIDRILVEKINAVLAR